MYPAFEVIFNGGWHVIWEGPLRPLSQTYVVRVEVVEFRTIGDLRVVGTLGANVTLISPELELSTDKAPGEDTPHLYWNERNPRKSRLCLFDPATAEWARDKAIAETIIPWAIDWLASYEGWRATGGVDRGRPTPGDSEVSDQLIEPRSKGALTHRRVQQPWPKEREFKILSIDGGGIKGIFPAMLLAEIEERYLGGGTVAEHFDLITGTSTGGIIALGLSIGMPARAIAGLYTEHGGEIFPAARFGWVGRKWQWCRDLARYRYDRAVLAELLSNTFGDRKFGDARSRLCIPSCDGRFGDVYVFKTPHHPDFKKDNHELMTMVAMATAAAPTYFQPLDSGGYRFVDGGLWANNPIMVGAVDALSCFDLDRHQVRVLSLGCGDEPYSVSDHMMKWGGLLSWKKAINGSIAFQSQNALGQVSLLLGAERVFRVIPELVMPPIELDDWHRAKSELPGAALSSFQVHGEAIRELFLSQR